MQILVYVERELLLVDAPIWIPQGSTVVHSMRAVRFTFSAQEVCTERVWNISPRMGF